MDLASEASSVDCGRHHTGGNDVLTVASVSSLLVGLRTAVLGG